MNESGARPGAERDELAHAPGGGWIQIADAELRRVNTIVEMLIEGKRQVKNHPPPVKLAPVKPPSREHPEPEQDVVVATLVDAEPVVTDGELLPSESAQTDACLCSAHLPLCNC